MKKFYIALSNGDFNQDIDSKDMSLIQFELNEGCQKYIIITEKKLSATDYTKISKILDK